MPEVAAGLTLLLNLLIGAGGQVYDNAHARIGVGDGNCGTHAVPFNGQPTQSSATVPTATAADTGLAASGAASPNTYYQAMMATFPSVAGAVVTLQSLFGTGVANFAWNEWSVDNGGASSAVAAGTTFNHKGIALITKTAGSTVTMTSSFTQS